MFDEFFNEASTLLTSSSVAAGLAMLVTLHPLRLKRLRTSDKGRELLKAQVLVAIAGALMVIVIGDSAARAFGLLGLGSFIRFRTAVRSPADTAIFFLLIGIGMACGIEHYGAAVLGTVMILVGLTVLEWLWPTTMKLDTPEITVNVPGE